MRRLDFLDLRDSLGVGAYRKIADRTGIDASYLSRCAYPEGKKGRKNIGQAIVSDLDQAYPGWRKRELEKIMVASGAGALAKARQEVKEPTPSTGMEHAYSSDDDGVNRQHRLQIRSVPVLNDKEIINGERLEQPERQYIPAQQVSSQAFAYPVSSIPNPNDRYGIDQDMHIVIDPDAEWENGKPLLVLDMNKNLIIRRYEVIGSKRYLAPYNDKYDPIEMDDSFTIIGKVISRHAIY